MRAGVTLGAALLLAAPAQAHEEHPADRAAPPEVAAPPLAYDLPAAGSYELPQIRRVGEHVLLAPDAQEVPLLGLGDGELAIVAFVYLHCADAQGCPLSLGTLQRADRALAARPDLRDRVRLVTVSFDPARDTPEAIGRLREGLAPRGDWRFLTAPSEEALRPVIDDYGQDVLPLSGDRLGHVTKVFLVDHEGRVRNVYSSGFLDHRLLLRDVETLLFRTPGRVADR